MGSEIAIPALLGVAILVIALGATSIWLRVSEVLGAEINVGAREPTRWFWAWQFAKLLIVAAAIWLAQELVVILWR
ncbi:hypothetical protein ASS64_00625 [Erythrobacter sp. AP23]|nr:hypothetical protein ASS64_00625 [Erythrobacter sp. AP23]